MARVIKEEADDRLHATACAEIIKPVDCSWEDLGKLLRDLRLGLHRLLNASIMSMVALDATHRGKKKVDKKSGLEKPNGPIGIGKLQTQAYVGVNNTLEGIYWDTALEALDDALDRDKLYGGKDNVAASIKLGLAGWAFAQYKKFRKGEFKGECVVPSFRAGVPIPVSASGSQWSVEKEGKSFILTAKLTPGRTPRTKIVLGIEGGGMYAHMNRIASGSEDIKLGDLKITKSKRSGKKWIALMSYSFPRPPRVEGEHVVAAHRGIANHLTMVSTTGRVWQLSGEQILEYKRRIGGRKRALKRNIKSSMPGSRGHGRRRRMATYSSLQDKESRWVRTRCQQDAAELGKFAERTGASTVLIEDYTTPAKRGVKADTHLDRLVKSWPFYQLKEKISWVCDKRGLELVEVPSEYISQRCPACGSTDYTQANHTTKLFTCLQCTYVRDIDTTAAFNMLASSGYDDKVKEILEKGKRIAERLKGGRAKSNYVESSQEKPKPRKKTKAKRTKRKTVAKKKVAAKKHKPVKYCDI